MNIQVKRQTQLLRIQTNQHAHSSAAANNNILSISSKSIQQDSDNFHNPLKPIIAQLEKEKEEKNRERTTFDLPPPIYGEHNQSNDAVLVFAYGYKPPAILRFVESLVNTGYDGDIVLGIDYDRLMKSLKEEEEKGGEEESHSYIAFKRYFEHRSKWYNLVVYNVKLECEQDNPTICTAPYMYYQEATTNKVGDDNHNHEFLPDPRIARSVKLLRYEYYWAWSTNYVGDDNDNATAGGRILVSDLRDVYFQQNPFVAPPFAAEELSSSTDVVAGIDRKKQKTLQVFVEDTSKFEIISQTSNARWIRTTKGEKVLEEIGHNPIGE